MSPTSELAILARQDAAQLLPLWEAVRRLVGLWANQYHAGQCTRLFDVDDLMQSGFLAMLDALRGYDPDKGEFTTYLRYHVRLVFAAVAGRRGAKRRPEVYASSLDEPLSDEGDMSLVDTIADPAAAFADDLIEREANRQDCAALMAEIDKLPDDQRRALLLTSWDGLAIKDAAEAMRLPAEQVKACQNKGLRKLRGSPTVKRLSASMAWHFVGLTQFNSTHTSSVEWAVLWAERQTQ